MKCDLAEPMHPVLNADAQTSMITRRCIYVNSTLNLCLNKLNKRFDLGAYRQLALVGKMHVAVFNQDAVFPLKTPRGVKL